jgi:hypothetical protein
MEKKYKAIIYIVACMSGLSIGVAIAYSGYIGLLYDRSSLHIGGFGGDSHREDLRYVDWAWGPSNEYCNITITNIGPIDVTIDQVVQVEIDNTKETLDAPVLPYTLTKDSSVTIKVAGTFISGTRYSFMVITARGNQFGPLTLTAP